MSDITDVEDEVDDPAYVAFLDQESTLFREVAGRCGMLFEVMCETVPRPVAARIVVEYAARVLCPPWIDEDWMDDEEDE